MSILNSLVKFFSFGNELLEGVERRREVRAELNPLSMSAQCMILDTESGEWYSGRIVNISYGGARIACTKFLPVERILQVLFIDNQAHQLISFKARIIALCPSTVLHRSRELRGVLSIYHRILKKTVLDHTIVKEYRCETTPEGGMPEAFKEFYKRTVRDNTLKNPVDRRTQETIERWCDDENDLFDDRPHNE